MLTPAEARADWVAALRSGEYKQTKGALAREDLTTGDTSYCCLGVACERAIKNGVNVSAVSRPSGRWGEVVVYYNDNDQILPFEVQKYLGLRSAAGKFSGLKSLAELNDNGYPFEQIAAMIEDLGDRL